MAAENSFDIACKLDMQEVSNAINQAKREIETRYDLKGAKNEIAQEKMVITITSAVGRAYAADRKASIEDTGDCVKMLK